MASSYRQGNDIRINWSIIDSEGNPYNLENRDLRLWMKVGMKQMEVTDYSVAGNIITWVYYGRDQITCGRLGSYDAILCENLGSAGMAMLDTQTVFKLVAHSWETAYGDGVRVITEPVVDIQSQLPATEQQLVITKAQYEEIFGQGSATHGGSAMETTDVLASLKDYIDGSNEEDVYLLDTFPSEGVSFTGEEIEKMLSAKLVAYKYDGELFVGQFTDDENGYILAFIRGYGIDGYISLFRNEVSYNGVITHSEEIDIPTVQSLGRYLLKTDASSTYLKIADAASTYLKIADALSRFVQSSGGVFTGPVAFSGGISASGGSFTGNVNMGGNRIRNLAAPTSANDAATKAYVDYLASLGIELVPVDVLPEASASTMGKIYLVPSTDPQTANSKDEFITFLEDDVYDWEQIGSTAIDLSGYMPKSGGTFTGDVNIYKSDLYVRGQIYVESGEILMTDDPVSDMAAINKGYVDDGLSGKQDTLVSGTNIKTINGLSIIGSGELTKHLIPSSVPPSKRWIVAPQGVSVCIASVHDVLLLDSDANMNVVHLLGSETYVAKVVEYQDETYLALGEFGDDEVDVFPVRNITELQFNKIDVVSDSDFDVLATVAVKSYQDKLISGTNIKKFAGRSILGIGDVTISIDGDTKYAIFPDEEINFIVWHPGGNGFGIIQTGAHFRAWNYGGFVKHICQISDNFAINVDSPHAYITFLSGSWNGTPTSRAASDVVSDPNYVSYDDNIINADTSNCVKFGEAINASNGYLTIYGDETFALMLIVVLDDDVSTYIVRGDQSPTVSVAKIEGIDSFQYAKRDDENGTLALYHEDSLTVTPILLSGTMPTITDLASASGEDEEIPMFQTKKELPSGGTTGQVLAKASGTDYDVEWRNGGGGGDTTDCVKYTQQSKTDNEKTTARTNIGITLHDDVIDVTPDPPIAVSYGKIGVISQTQTWTQAADGGYDYAMNGQVTGLIPQADIDLFVANGATFNPNGYQAGVGYFELNGLTDISYNEMLEIYRWSAGLQNRVSYELAFMARTLRTNFNLLPPYQGVTAFGSLSVTNVDLRGVAAYSQMEVFAFMGDDDPASTVTKYHKIGNLSFSFRGISAQYYSKIKTIIGALNIDAITTDTSISFQFCPCLEDVRIYHLKANLGLQSSPRLTAASVAYMINNVGTTNNIVITLHATAYARANADADVQAALAAHTNVSLASA